MCLYRIKINVNYHRTKDSVASSADFPTEIISPDA